MEEVAQLVVGSRTRSVNVKLTLDDLKKTLSIVCTQTTESSMCFSQKIVDQHLNMTDIIGCQVLKGDSMDAGCLLGFYCYILPAVESNAKRRPRKRLVCIIRFANKQLCTKWQMAIKHRIAPKKPPHMREICESNNRKLLVFVNPQSGPGRALQIFQKSVLPVFAEAGFESKLVVTEYSMHAHKLVQTLDLGEYSGIVIVSGDGLVFEVLNGLFLRPDRAQALSIPIGVIPGGSGNALAASILYQNQEPFDALGDFGMQSAVNICRSQFKPINLIHVETPTQNFAGFMSVAWGLLSDIDIESEKYRKPFGITRFHVGTTVRLMFLRSYRGRISYLPADENQNSSPSNANNISMKREKIQNGIEPAAWAKVHAKPDPPSTAELRNMWSTGRDADIPFINEPIPAHWKVLEDEFCFVQLTFLSHIAQDLPMCPRSRMDDGLIYLIYIPSSECSRYSLFTYLVDMSDQKHVDYSMMKVIACKSVRVEALSGSGVMTLDGELLKGQTMQATVTDFCGTVM